MQKVHYALRKHLRTIFPDYKEDEETVSDVDMHGDLYTDTISSIKFTN